MPWWLLDERECKLAPTIININYKLTLTKGGLLKSNFIGRAKIYNTHYDPDLKVIIKNRYTMNIFEK